MPGVFLIQPCRLKLALQYTPGLSTRFLLSRRVSSTSYCVAVARALATANKETYTREFDKSRKELGFYAAKRWDYVVACENVGARCELDLDDLFLSMLEAQTGVTQTQQKQYTEMSSAVETATELSKVRLMLLSRRAKSNAA